MRKWSHRIRGADVDLEVQTVEVERIIKELGATPAVVRAAMSRALKRTASSLRVASSKRIVPELELRRAGDFRNRIRNMRTRLNANGGVLGVWYGLNDFPVSWFKGRPRRVRRREKGPSFRGSTFDGAFVARRRGSKGTTIYRREGKSRFPIREEGMPIKDRVDVILEDEILPDAADLFLDLFVRDLRARMKFKVGAGHE